MPFPDVPTGSLKAGRIAVLEFPLAGEAPVYSGSVSCLLFVDGAVVGNAEEIARIRKGRANVLRVYQERLDLLSRLLDYERARAVLYGDPSGLTSAQKQFLRELRSLWAAADPNSWPDKVRYQIDDLSRSIESIKSHLTRDSQSDR